MLKSWPIAPNHEDLFIQHYQWLMGWALRMTDRNQEQAEDLVHDCFVHFTISRPSLPAIEGNLEGYLYTMLRNLHLSQVRRSTRIRETIIALPDHSLLDYDSVEFGLKALEQQAQEQLQLQIQDELRRICQYACMRKETSKAGSVLLLRFFHGYYPIEIAGILKSPRGAVNELLRAARSEARVYLANPASLGFVSHSQPPAISHNTKQSAEDFLAELRHSIWRSQESDECLSIARIQELYQPARTEGIDNANLAHIVSCERCLDEVNRLLDLPLLATRYPMNTLGKDTRPKDKERGGGPSGAGGAGGGSNDEFLKRSRKRRRDVLEHRPKELRISVNGFVIGSHQISSRVNKQTVSVNVEEKIGFVEVFSEREVRLLFCSVEMPPDGPVEHKERVELSDGRTLEMTLSFDEPWPALHVTYEDPAFSEAAAGQTINILREASDETPLSALPVDAAGPRRSVRVPPGFISHAWRRLFGSGQAWRLLARPGVVTAVFAFVLIAVLLFVYMRPVPPLSAADVLKKSALAEDADLVVRPDLAIHRTVNLEERLASGELVAQSHIDIWQSASSQTGRVKAARVYDKKNQLIAGIWTKRDGTQMVYHHGAKPQVQPPENQESETVALLDSDSIWRLEPSARNFTTLVPDTGRTTIEESSDSYLITYSGESGSGAGVLFRVKLVLNKTDLHATEQILVVRRSDGLHEYKFTESGFARHPVNAVAPNVFELDSELLGKTNDESKAKAESEANPSSLLLTHPGVAATAELEVEVVGLLNRADAFLGEQITVNRSPGGPLQVNAIVEKEERKRELLQALTSVSNNPAVRVQIETVAEAAERQARQEKSFSAPITSRQVEIAKEVIPADAELRAYLSARKGLSGSQLEEEIRRYSDRVMARSQQARMQALALKQIVERFSLNDLRTLSPESRAKWLGMVRERASAFQRESTSLRRELEPLFPGLASSGETSGEIDLTTDDGLVQGVRRLYELAAADDEAVSRSFSVYAQSPQSAPVKQTQFWRSLQSAEALAARIQSAR
jgi:RNA polymerase sigma factor (sigma-70 family)